MNVRIISKHHQMKQFDTVDEFNKYYAKHKEEIDAKTSNQLNKELKIKGFKITKRNMKTIDNEGKQTRIGELCLKHIEPNIVPITNDDKLAEVEARITQLELKINQLIDIIAPIISAEAPTIC